MVLEVRAELFDVVMAEDLDDRFRDESKVDLELAFSLLLEDALVVDS